MAKMNGKTRMTAQKIDEKLSCIKSNIKDFREYFNPNFKRFNHSRRFVFETSFSSDDIEILKETGKPQLEFNIGEAYLSRQRGEFSKQEPTINVFSKATAKKPVDTEMIEFLQNHLYAVLFDSNRDNLLYDVYTDCLSGGFSALKVFTEYCSPMSFDQDVKIQRVFDPTLIIFDKAARLSHKGDGAYSGELFPKTYEEVVSTYGSDIGKDLKFKGRDSLEGFNWSYSTSNGEKIMLIGDYYEKKAKKKKIVQVYAGKDRPPYVMTEKEYEEFRELWSSQKIEQVPDILGKPRVTDIETIDRYVICGDSVIEHNTTDWRYLPHVFVDGNSLIMRRDTEGSSYQLTRPFLYHMEGIQKLKNFAGICLANELENTVQHKFMIARESIPSQYADAYTDIQKASVLIYNAFAEDNPEKPLPAPTAAPRSPIPPEITSTFTITDQMTQTILGTYDSSLGINDNNLSGIAISNGATQSNAASLPYIVSFMKAMTHVGMIIVDLIPKYVKTPRTMPVMNKKGKREFVKVNQEGGVSLEYDSYDLDLNIEAGVSFEIQRAQAFSMMTNLMQISPMFREFMDKSSNGIATLLDNLNIRGIDRLKLDVESFLLEQKQKEQEAMQMQQQAMQQDMQMKQAQIQMAQQNNPMDLKRQEFQFKVQKESEELRLEAQKESEELRLEQERVNIEMMKAESEIENQNIENLLRASEIDARNARTHVDMMNKERAATHGEKSAAHSRAMDLLKLHNSGKIGSISVINNEEDSGEQDEEEIA